MKIWIWPLESLDWAEKCLLDMAGCHTAAQQTHWEKPPMFPQGTGDYRTGFSLPLIEA